MAWVSVSKLILLVMILLAGVLQDYRRATLHSNAASLCYSFTVNKSESGPWRQKVQGQLNKETFLYCDSTNNCHAIGVLGKRMNITKIWETQIGTLKDGGDLFKDQAIQMNLGKNTIRGSLPLQARVCCWHEVDGRFSGSWDFDLNGHKMCFDPSTGKWTEVDPGSSRMKQMWEKNRDVIGFLKKTSEGDCNSWLKNFKSHYEEKLEPQASSTAAPDVDLCGPLSQAIKPSTSILLIILICFLLLFLSGESFAMTG